MARREAEFSPTNLTGAFSGLKPRSNRQGASPGVARTSTLSPPYGRLSKKFARPLEPERTERAPDARIDEPSSPDQDPAKTEPLFRENWLLRKGHTLTYVCLFLFTFALYFRPYELFPTLAPLNSMALVLAVATLLVYLPTQLATEGNVTVITPEVKAVLFLAFWAVVTIPIARDPGLAWQTFADVFSKVVLIFIVMVNTLRTKRRLMGLVWLAIAVGLMLTYQAIDLYQKGEFKTEGYRVSLDFGGMFGNPNDLAMHLAIVTPLAIVLGLATRNLVAKIAYFASAGMMIVGNMVTQSRGGFLGLMAVAGVLAWKLGRRRRLKALMILVLFAGGFLAFAPSNYGVRIMSIFDTALDPVGSSNQRTELLKRSIVVTLRNPQGIGLGNFPVVGQGSRQTHNSYTQVSSELGWLCFAAYLLLLLVPLRRLGMIERDLDSDDDHSWMFYMVIGVQASLAAYLAASFFGSVAYHWYAFYPIAFAVCLRRLYAERKQAEMK